MFKKKLFSLGGVVILLFLLVASVAFTEEEKETKFGIGFQGSFPAWGISGMMDVADNISVQGIVGLMGDLKMYAGKGIYKFRKEPYWNAYGYGTIGRWSYPGYKWEEWDLVEITETTMGFGVGVGIEYDWRGWDPKLPPIFGNVEIGFGKVEFDEVDYDFSTLMWGGGLHYRF